MERMSNKKREHGFSLIELLLVVTIIGIISAIAVPSMQKGLKSADCGAAFATLKTASSTQVGFFGSNGRFANLNELNSAMTGSLGTVSGTFAYRGRFAFQMTPATPTNAQLKDGYSLTATRDTSAGDALVVYQVDQTGVITNPPF